MFRFGMIGTGARQWMAVAIVSSLALVIVWLGVGRPSMDSARDYEECIELAQAQRVSNEEVNNMMTGCGARFAGRRKASGGYTYYDFMQDRKFDIAGPNPTAVERKEIDRQYIVYLEAQRREAISEALAKQQNDMLREDMESARQPAGPPIVLTPPSLAAAAKQHAATATAIGTERPKAKHCTEDTLSCSLSKITTAVKNAFASTSKTKQ